MKTTPHRYDVLIRLGLRSLWDCALATPHEVADIFINYSAHVDQVHVTAHLGGWERDRPAASLHIDVPLTDEGAEYRGGQTAAALLAGCLAELEAFVAVAPAAIEKRNAHEAELALRERQAFGEAVLAHGEAREHFLASGEGEETVKMRALAVDRLMSEMKFEKRGIWWDEKHSTWGLGEAPWREDEMIPLPEGAVSSGPHN